MGIAKLHNVHSFAMNARSVNKSVTNVQRALLLENISASHHGCHSLSVLVQLAVRFAKAKISALNVERIIFWKTIFVIVEEMYKHRLMISENSLSFLKQLHL